MTNKRKSCRMYSDASAAGNNPRRVQVVMAQFFRQKETGSLFQSPWGGILVLDQWNRPRRWRTPRTARLAVSRLLSVSGGMTQ
jgi:hypothetical protein